MLSVHICVYVCEKETEFLLSWVKMLRICEDDISVSNHRGTLDIGLKNSGIFLLIALQNCPGCLFCVSETSSGVELPVWTGLDRCDLPQPVCL